MRVTKVLTKLHVNEGTLGLRQNSVAKKAAKTRRTEAEARLQKNIKKHFKQKYFLQHM